MLKKKIDNQKKYKKTRLKITKNTMSFNKFVD